MSEEKNDQQVIEKHRKVAWLERKAWRQTHSSDRFTAPSTCAADRPIFMRALFLLCPWERSKYPGRHKTARWLLGGLALSTARTYLSGKRALPARHARAIADLLRSRAEAMKRMVAELEEYAVQREARERQIKETRESFCTVKIRDSSGIPRDARYRGGKLTGKARLPPNDDL